MSLLSFLKTLKLHKFRHSSLDSEEYIPAFWEDDYCQIEIVPVENKAFILKQAKEIGSKMEESKNPNGFAETFERGTMPTRTLAKEIRTDRFEQTLLAFQFKRAKSIRYQNRKILNCETGNIKAFGISNFTIFFKTDEEFVKHIWVHIGFFDPATKLELLETAFYTLGEGYELILIDWNRQVLVELSNKNQIQRYLREYFK